MAYSNRFQGIDLLKCIAILTIPSQHFFSHHSHFRDVEFNSVSLLIQSMGLEFFLIGVPLFIAITGYLSQQTEPTWTYYRKILRVLVPYTLISIVYLFIRKFYFNDNFDILDGVRMILGFNAIPYAWYIEMWIGLFLLAPFLNLLYRNIKTAKTSFILIAILYIMTYLTMTVNREGFHLLPDYWVSISPLTSFFIGCHIRKFGAKIEKRTLILFIFLAIITEPVINLFFFNGQPYRFVLGIYLLIVPEMAATFVLLYKWTTNKEWLQKLLALVSNHTLEMYLYCALCDMVLYPFFLKWFISQNQFGLFFFVIIPIELIATFCLAWITNNLIKISQFDRLWKSPKLEKK